MTLPEQLKGGSPTGSAIGLRVLDDTLMLPAAILRKSRVTENRRWMRDFVTRTGLALCPHGKTSMSPAILAMQVEDGAWGLTAATASHVRLYRAWGHKRILLANQLVGRANIAWVRDEQRRDPAFEFFCLVDSAAGVSELLNSVEAGSAAPPFKVLIEVGDVGKRAGVRSMDEALELAHFIRGAGSSVELVGVETFEGVHQADPDGAPKVAGLTARVIDIADRLLANDLFGDGTVLLSIGGSAYYDIVGEALASAAQRQPRFKPILRSGCYVTHDSGMYARLFAEAASRDRRLNDKETLRPALEVWAQIQSMPEPGLAIVALGKRDIGADAGLPSPIAWAGPNGTRQACGSDFEPIALYDQHLCLRIPPETPWRVGTLIGFGVSHPCTTFDKWRTLHLVDDDDRVIETIETYF